MKFTRLLRSLFAVLSILVTTAVLAIVVTPYLLDSQSIRTKAMERLSSWSGGQILLNGPVRLKYFPGISLTAKKIEIRNVKNLPSLEKVYAKKLHVDLNLLSLVFGRVEIDRLKLSSPNIIIDYNRLDKTPQYVNLDSTPFLKVLRQTSIEKLIIEKGIVRIANTPKGTEVFRNIDTKWYFSGSSQNVKGSGVFSWRKKRTKYNFTTDSMPSKALGNKLKLTFTASNSLFSTRFSGEADFQKALQLNGNKSLDVKEIRGFSKWLRYPLPSSDGFNTFSAQGDVTWSENQISFVNGIFKLDGNAANGTLALDYSKAKPKLDGTLAVQDFSLSPYLASLESSKKYNKTKDFSLSLLKHFDADFRISTEQISLNNFKTGHGAMTVSLKDNILLADIAEIEICDGRASGHFQLNATNSMPKLVVNASLNDVETNACFETFALKSLLEGKALIKVNVTAKGKTFAGLLNTLDGKLSLNITNGGRVNFAISDLFSDPTTTQYQGWAKIKGQTKFDSLSASMAMLGGKGQMQNLVIQAGDTKYLGNGILHFVTNQLDYKFIKQAQEKTEARSLPKDISKEGVALSIQGDWQHPVITVDSVSVVNTSPKDPS